MSNAVLIDAILRASYFQIEERDTFLKQLRACLLEASDNEHGSSMMGEFHDMAVRVGEFIHTAPVGCEHTEVTQRFHQLLGIM